MLIAPIPASHENTPLDLTIIARYLILDFP